MELPGWGALDSRLDLAAGLHYDPGAWDPAEAGEIWIMADRRRTKEERVPRNPWGLPALAAAIGLTCLLSFTAALDNDLWWHLATGRWIASGAGIPTTDPFTFTAFGRPWITHEWLSGLLFYQVHRLGGTDLLIVGKSAIAGMAILLSALAGIAGAGRSRDRLAGAAVGALLAASLIAPRAFVRPHMLTALLLGALLLLLRQESASGRRIWRILPAPLFLLWANLHSGFVLGLALWGLYWIGEWAASRIGGVAPAVTPNWRERGAALALAFAATLANPHFFQAHLYPFHLVAREEVRGSIVELRSLFHSGYAGALFPKVAILAGVATGILVFDSRRRIAWSLLLPGLLFAALAVASVRGLSEFSVILPALLGAHGDRLGARRGLARAVCVATILLAVAGGAAAIIRGTPMGGGTVQRIGLTVEPGSRPESAAAFLRETRPGARIFNLLSYGGYLIYELGPETKVFIDGRLDIYPPGFLDAYTRTLGTGEGWKEAVDRYGIEIAVVNHVPQPERDRGLRDLLRNDPNWVCVMAGDYSLVYAHRVPANAAIIERYGLPFDPSARHREFIGEFVSRASPDDLDRAVGALDAMHRIAPEEIAPSLFAAQILDRVGRSAAAVPRARSALSLDPGSDPLRLFLAETLQRADSLDGAVRALEPMLARDPAPAAALSLRGLIARSAGNLDEAIGFLERGAAADPSDPVVQVRLGVVKAEAGRIAEGRRHLERALAIRPGDPSAVRNLRALETMEIRERDPLPPPARHGTP